MTKTNKQYRNKKEFNEAIEYLLSPEYHEKISKQIRQEKVDVLEKYGYKVKK